MNVEELNRRHHRKVMAGEGIYHDGDCNIFRSKICTCGLLHALNVIDNPLDHYAKYIEEWVDQEKTIGSILSGIHAMQILTLRPGDTLVVSVQEILSSEQIGVITESLKDQIGHKVLILERGARLSVISECN